MSRTIDAAIGWIESAVSLDGPGYLIGKAKARTTQVVGRPAKSLGNLLHGRLYGHPVHPMAVAIPIGTWTMAVVLDVLSITGIVPDRDAKRAADLSLKVGAAGAVLALATGLADWQHLNGRDRRVGLVHGTVNSTALGLNLVSIVLRARGRQAAGRWASSIAWAWMGVGGYLGGHLVYRRRAAVDHADRSPEPREFKPVLPFEELAEGVPHRVAVWDEVARQEVGIVLVRQGERVHAMGARCSHAGGPLDQGWVLDGTLVCPWHGSRYHLETAQPTAGPSTCPQPRYVVRLRDGIVELKREQEPGDEVVTEDSLGRLRANQVRKSDPDDVGNADATSRTATEILFEHHQMIRRLFDRMLATSDDAPNRHELMRTLASELDIHEIVEDAVFYPAVRPVSEDVNIAYAEHGVLADLLAATIKLLPTSSGFNEHLRALQAAFLHHAGSEERSMFIEAERLSDARLRTLGHELETMLDTERTSRFRRAFRDLKLSLLETV
ncbi:MAG: DUF2231 domain-containing protein [Janthinobacterium lividum]